MLACCAFAWSEGWVEIPSSRSTTLDPDERKAVELQCRSMEGVLRSSCERETAESLVAGEFDPDAILRLHCTRYDNHWFENIETPPNLCIQRYGGWLHG